MTNTIENTATFFHLRGSQDPFNPVLTSRVLSHLGNSVSTSAFKGERARSHDLLIERTKPTGLGIVMESFAPYMGSHQSDLEMIIYRTTTSTLPMDALMIIIPYMELRDDRPDRNAGELATLYARRIAQSDQNKKTKAVAVWESHSKPGLDILVKAFEELGNPVKIIPLTTARLAAQKFLEKKENDCRKKFALVAPDLGSLHRTMTAAQVLNIPVILFEKIRPKIEKVAFKDVYIADPNSGLAVQAKENALKDFVVFTIDDLSGTSRTNVVAAKTLRRKYRVAEVHAAITHAALIQPEAKKRLFAAMEKKTIASVTFSDSLPITIDGDVETISIAKPTAALIRVAAGKGTEEDMSVLEQVSSSPGPSKSEIKKLLLEGRLPLVTDLWPPAEIEVSDIFPDQGLIYQYSAASHEFNPLPHSATS